MSSVETNRVSQMHRVAFLKSCLRNHECMRDIFLGKLQKLIYNIHICFII